MPVTLHFSRAQRMQLNNGLKAVVEVVPNITTKTILGPVLRRAAAPAAQYLKSATPKGTGPLGNRSKRLYQSVAIRTANSRNRRNPSVYVSVGWRTGKSTGITPAHATATEFGNSR